MYGKLCLLLAIMVKIYLAGSQPEMKEVNENLAQETSNQIDIENLNEKLKELHLLIEDNRLLTWNRLESTVALLEGGFNSKMDNIKMDLTARITETKSDIVRESEKLSSEMNKLTTNIDKQMKIVINKVSEKAANVNINDKIITELNEIKEINKNSNRICENNQNIFKELILKFSAPSKNCAELLIRGDNISGIKFVSGVDVLCDQDTDGGGWTVFQRRDDLPIREDFYRNWADYSKGFGNLTGEFWLGLENLHNMTKYTKMELRVELEDVKGYKASIKYESFFIESWEEKFRLNLGKPTGRGTLWDSLVSSNQMNFTTRDQDNDLYQSGNCAKEQKGAWWFSNCGNVNLNGFQFVGKYSNEPPFIKHGIRWGSFGGGYNSMRRTSMMFRPQK